MKELLITWFFVIYKKGVFQLKKFDSSKKWNPFPKALKTASNSLSNSVKSWTNSITIQFPKFIRPNSKHCNEYISWHVCFHESFHTCLILCHFLESNSRLIFSSKNLMLSFATSAASWIHQNRLVLNCDVTFYWKAVFTTRIIYQNEQ